jgi:glycosyltransferase involved in cell wall biosynthesis
MLDEERISVSDQGIGAPKDASVGDAAMLRGILPETADMAPETAPLKVSILMCAFNEQQRITQAIREVLCTTYPCPIELIVIDDGSTDATALLAERINDPRLIVHRHSENRGKGAALRTASSLATGTYILPFDADLEYSPEDIPKLINPIIKRRCSVVYGARLFGFNTVYQSYRYALGNRFMTRMASVLFDANLSDLHTCLKLVPLALFRRLALRETRFGLDTELTATLLRLGIRPFEVPISYYSRSHAEGKKINWRDALACIAILFKVRVRRRRRLFVGAGDDGKTLSLQGSDLLIDQSLQGSDLLIDHVRNELLSAFNMDGNAGEEAIQWRTG